MSAYRSLLTNPAVTPAAKAAIRASLARPRVASVPRERSPLELRFLKLWHDNGGPELVEEYQFHETRRWRFDFAHPKTMTAIECEGGLYKRGRHNSADGFNEDVVKYNTAQFMGWVVFRITSKVITTPWIVALIARCEGREVEVPA